MAFALVMCGMFCLVREPSGDDLYFQGRDISSLEQLGDFLTVRYREWSSRLFPEVVILLLLRMDLMVWRIFSVANLLIAAYAIRYLAGIGNSVWKNALVCLLVASFPFSYHASAGWVTTTSVYLMPAAMGLAALIPLRRQAEALPCPWWQNVLYLLATMVACGHEQVCAVILGAHLCVCGYLYISRRKISRMQFCQTGICAGSILFILTCPGNAVRAAAELRNWQPEYAGWTLPEKLVRGILHGADYFCYAANVNWICAGMLAVLSVCVFHHVRENWKKVVSFTGAVWMCAAAVIIRLQGRWLPLKTAVFRWGTYGENPLSQTGDVIRALSALAVMALVVCELYWLSANSVDFWLGSMIFTAGYGSEVVVCFSPTIYASGNRVFTFWQYGVFLLLCHVTQGLYPDTYGKKERAVLLSAALFSVLSVIRSLRLLFGM